MTEGDLLLYVLSVLPFFAVFVVGAAVQTRNKRRNLLSEKVLRPPAHSLKQQLEKVIDQHDTLALAALGVPLLTIVSLKQANVPRQAMVFPLIGFGIVLALIGLRLLAQRRRLRVGADGEVIVAEFLNDLRGHGCKIYHDFPTDYGNIDHIIVGPGGVFAVETKARRKSRGAEGHKVFLKDGALHFPTGRDEQMIPQARRQAEWLQKHLAKGALPFLKVEPILALPGWWVELKEKPPFLILNPKQIAPNVSKRPPVLSQQEIQRIGHNLEQRVRDMEV